MSLSLNVIKIHFMCMFLTYVLLPSSSCLVRCCQILFSFYADLGKNKMKMNGPPVDLAEEEVIHLRKLVTINI